MPKKQNTAVIDEFKVYRLLKKQGLKKGDLALLFGISRQGILWRFDNGWTPAQAQELADYLEVSVRSLRP